MRRRLLILLAGVVLAAARAHASLQEDLAALRVRDGDTEQSLAEVLGDTPALVAFWATYCPPCRAEVPALSHAAARAPSLGVRVVSVCVDVDDAARLAHARTAWGIDYPTLWTPSSERARLQRLLPRGLPTSFLVSRHGVTREERLLDEDRVDAILEALAADGGRGGTAPPSHPPPPPADGDDDGAPPAGGSLVPAALHPATR